MTVQAARDIAHTLQLAGDAMSERVARIGRTSTTGWSGAAHDAMAARTEALRSDLGVVPSLVEDARRALDRFADISESAHIQQLRSDELMREATALTRRWQAEPERQQFDPGASMRWRAIQMRSEAAATERAAARRAAASVGSAAQAISARAPLGAGGRDGAFGVFDGLGDILDKMIDTVGDGFEWGWDRTTDLAGWAADQASRIVDGVVWVGDLAIDVGQNVFERVVDEAQVAYARARFPADFALFHAPGNTPDGLPDISDEYRRSQNVWSYSLIPVIEETGGQCTRLDNGIFACLSDGIELPGDLGMVPLKGRGGTTYGEVFIVDDPDQYARVQQPGSPLAEHEKNHSIQWAIHGPAVFVLLYLQDVALSGNNGENQYFEQQAGAEAGGYGN